MRARNTAQRGRRHDPACRARPAGPRRTCRRGPGPHLGELTHHSRRNKTVKPKSTPAPEQRFRAGSETLRALGAARGGARSRSRTRSRAPRPSGGRHPRPRRLHPLPTPLGRREPAATRGHQGPGHPNPGRRPIPAKARQHASRGRASREHESPRPRRRPASGTPTRSAPRHTHGQACSRAGSPTGPPRTNEIVPSLTPRKFGDPPGGQPPADV